MERKRGREKTWQMSTEISETLKRYISNKTLETNYFKFQSNEKKFPLAKYFPLANYFKFKFKEKIYFPFNKPSQKYESKVKSKSTTVEANSRKTYAIFLRVRLHCGPEVAN